MVLLHTFVDFQYRYLNKLLFLYLRFQTSKRFLHRHKRKTIATITNKKKHVKTKIYEIHVCHLVIEFSFFCPISLSSISSHPPLYFDTDASNCLILCYSTHEYVSRMRCISKSIRYVYIDNTIKCCVHIIFFSQYSPCRYATRKL